MSVKGLSPALKTPSGTEGLPAHHPPVLCPEPQFFHMSNAANTSTFLFLRAGRSRQGATLSIEFWSGCPEGLVCDTSEDTTSAEPTQILPLTLSFL